MRTTVRRHDVDAGLEQMGAEVRDLLLRDLDLLQAGGDLLERQDAPLAPLGREISKLVHLHEARLGGLLQQSDSGLMLLRQPSLLHTAGPPGAVLEWDSRVVGTRGLDRDGAGRWGQIQGRSRLRAIVQRLVRFASLRG
jgi:hypothetical protein